MNTSSTTALGSSFTLRGVTLKNRVVISPMCMYSAQDGIPDDFHLAHLGRFALGGAGLVFTEATAINKTGRITVGCLGLWNDEQEHAHSRLVALVHRLGAAAGVQLNHSGRKGSSERPWDGGGPLYGSSVLESALHWQTVGATDTPISPRHPAVHALTADEITAIVADFVEAARRADRAGYDVLEVHCAHGYLLHQFLSPLSNTRQDRYGGSLEARMRFALDVVTAVRAVWPKSKPLFVRCSSVDGVDVGWSLEDSIVFVRRLKAIGVDVIDCSSGGMPLPAEKQLVARKPGFHLPYSEAIRKQADIPTVAVGLIKDPQFARGIVEDGKADLVAIGREALFNPNWANHAFLQGERADAWGRWPRTYGWWLKRREL